MIRLIAYLLLAASAQAAQYFVRSDGSNSNLGTTNSSGGAWLTIQKAATTMVAGDTVTVQAGTYTEDITSGASGNSSNRITFNTNGTVYIQGRLTLSHDYITFDGFMIRYAGSTSNLHGYVWLNSGADECIVENCTIGPGSAIKLTDIAFNDTNPDTITSATGGFSAAGFRNGGTVKAMNSVSGSDINVSNRTGWTIDTVTDNTITLASGQNVVAESGKTAFLYGIQNAFVFHASTNNIIIRNNSIEDAACRWVLLNGTGHLIEGNTFSNMDGFDGILYGGTNVTIRRNLIHECMSYRYWSPSPDNLGVASGVGTITNILLEENMFIDSLGAAGFDHGTPNPGPYIWRRNVFANIAHGYALVSTDARFENNTWYKVSNPTSVLAGGPSAAHPITWSNWAGSATVGTITGNIFAGCGEIATGDPLLKGWYSNAEPDLTLTANYNMVTGPSPTFHVKTGFSETNGINGGDPMFVDPSDPLGPDGLIFTADDGLRLAEGSPAIGAGPAGADLGAYDYEATPSGSGTINATITNATTITVGP
jgi:hypothetical protein